jgi:hypothetical protein
MSLQDEVTQNRKAITEECKKTVCERERERERGEWLEIVPHRHTRHCDISILKSYFKRRKYS